MVRRRGGRKGQRRGWGGDVGFRNKKGSLLVPSTDVVALLMVRTGYGLDMDLVLGGKGGGRLFEER